MKQLLPKVGLLISLVFSFVPFPTLYHALFVDKKAIQAFSLPGCIMGLACCMIIGSFCTLQGFIDCQIGCGLGIISGLSQLLTISYL